MRSVMIKILLHSNVREVLFSSVKFAFKDNRTEQVVWDYVLNHTWVPCEESLDIEHSYYYDVDGWIENMK